MNRTTYNAICAAVEHAEGCPSRLGSSSAVVLLRAMVGVDRSRLMCHQLCRMYRGLDDETGALSAPLMRHARERWGARGGARLSHANCHD